MKTTYTFLQSIWLAMLILVSTFLFGATSATAGDQGDLSSSKQEITLEAKSGVAVVSTTVLVTNNSRATLSVHAKLFGANASLFAITPVEFILKAGAKKEITVKFSFTNSTAERTTATLTFSVGDSISLKIPLTGINTVSGSTKTWKADSDSLLTPAAKTTGNSTTTSTEVKSPTSTSTEVRSPTSTSTQAHTSGNVTVTGGAGAGATTTVTIINTTRQLEEKDTSSLISEWVNTLGQTVQRTIDATGNIVEHTLDTTGKVMKDTTVDRLLDLKVINQTTNAAGQTVKQVRDTNGGAVIEYTLDKTGKIINSRVVSKASGKLN